MTPYATTVLDRLTRIYPAAADPALAPGMRAYMRDQFPYLGIRAPRQRQLGREVLAGLDRPTPADLADVATACWALPEREYQYFACDLLRRHARTLPAGALATVRRLILATSWWDTIDTLAADVVGPMVAAHPTLKSTMDIWVVDENLWLARTAILHQLTYRDATDAERLFRYCLLQAGHRDFFIRKAIGWALRQYARTAPDAVRAFLAAHGSQLSPLSVREAAKHLGTATGSGSP